MIRYIALRTVSLVVAVVAAALLVSGMQVVQQQSNHSVLPGGIGVWVLGAAALLFIVAAGIYRVTGPKPQPQQQLPPL